jgi:hypothetical protein
VGCVRACVPVCVCACAQPENIMLDPGPEGVRGVIGDFGLSVTVPDARRPYVADKAGGTPAYLAPEVRGARARVRTTTACARLGVCVRGLVRGT